MHPNPNEAWKSAIDLVLGRYLKSNLMLWSTGEYCRMTCFPQMKRCYSKEEWSDVIFPTRQRACQKLQKQPTKWWLENKSIMFWPWAESRFEKRTGRHFSTTYELFEAIHIEGNNTDSSSCKKLSTSFSVLLYLHSIFAIHANFLTSDLGLKWWRPSKDHYKFFYLWFGPTYFLFFCCLGVYMSVKPSWQTSLSNMTIRRRYQNNVERLACSCFTENFLIAVLNTVKKYIFKICYHNIFSFVKSTEIIYLV